MKKYKVLKTRRIGGNVFTLTGDIVFEYMRHDYGMASMDSLHTQVDHISVTRDMEGDDPFFTIPVKHLEEIDAS